MQRDRLRSNRMTRVQNLYRKDTTHTSGNIKGKRTVAPCTDIYCYVLVRLGNHQYTTTRVLSTLIKRNFVNMPAELADDTGRKLDEYKHFVEETLKPRLTHALQSHEATKSELEDFITLQNELLRWNEPDGSSPSLRIKTDLGHERLFCDAKVDDVQNLFVHVGYGFHVELTREEAIHFSKRKIEYLKSKERTRQLEIEKLTLHVSEAKQILEQLDELQGR